jgi:hypothetical protein
LIHTDTNLSDAELRSYGALRRMRQTMGMRISGSWPSIRLRGDYRMLDLTEATVRKELKRVNAREEIEGVFMRRGALYK